MLRLEFEPGTLRMCRKRYRWANMFDYEMYEVPGYEYESAAKKRTPTSIALLWTVLSYMKRDLARRVIYIQQRRQDYWKWLCNAEQLSSSDETVPRLKFPSNVVRERTMGWHSIVFQQYCVFRM